MVPCYHMITPFRTRRAKAARKAKAWERDEGTGRSPPAILARLRNARFSPVCCVPIVAQDPLGGARSFLYNKGEPQGACTPHGSRTCFGGSDLFGSRFVPLGRPGFIFRLNLQNKRSRLHSQVAESSEQAENLQDNSGKAEYNTIHGGHPLPYI